MYFMSLICWKASQSLDKFCKVPSVIMMLMCQQNSLNSCIPQLLEQKLIVSRVNYCQNGSSHLSACSDDVRKVIFEVPDHSDPHYLYSDQSSVLRTGFGVWGLGFGVWGL